MYLKAWASFQIFVSSEVNHQVESPLSSFPVQSVYIEYNIAVQHSTAGW
jgi:hypothetical protein